MNSSLTLPLLADLGVSTLLRDFVLLSMGALVLGLVFKLARQPTIVAYIVVGIVVSALFGDEVEKRAHFVEEIGSLGLILLMFFIGMEISLPELVRNWKAPVLGTLLQIAVSVVAMVLIGLNDWNHWDLRESILIGLVISLSSSAVVFTVLEQRGLMHSGLGSKVIGILLIQDILVVPMLIGVDLLGGEKVPTHEIVKASIGGALVLGFMAFLVIKRTLRPPAFVVRMVKHDQDLLVFGGFLLCFGFAATTGLLGLSSALGAFVAGLLVSSLGGSHRVHEALNAFRVVFLAVFFVSIGLLVDLPFVWANWGSILLTVFLIFLTNNVINAVVLKYMGAGWSEAFFGGALLSQVGEFSFVLAVAGHSTGLIPDFYYKEILATIVISLLLSSLWIEVVSHTNHFMRSKRSRIRTMLQRTKPLPKDAP